MFVVYIFFSIGQVVMQQTAAKNQFDQIVTILFLFNYEKTNINNKMHCSNIPEQCILLFKYIGNNVDIVMDQLWSIVRYHTKKQAYLNDSLPFAF